MSIVSADTVLDIFRRVGALLEGHFRLTSGLHSPGYLQCARVLQYPGEAEGFGAAIAGLVGNLGVEAVLSPALGGIVIGHEVARALGVRALFAERQDGSLTLRRGFEFSPGERVLVVEDVVTTGGSTRETMEVARAAGATVVGAASIIDRSGGQQELSASSLVLDASSPADLMNSGSGHHESPPNRDQHKRVPGTDVPYFSLAAIALPTYEPQSCPLCAEGRPVVKPGSRT